MENVIHTVVVVTRLLIASARSVEAAVVYHVTIIPAGTNASVAGINDYGQVAGMGTPAGTRHDRFLRSERRR